MSTDGVSALQTITLPQFPKTREMEDPYMHLDPADFFNLLESNQLSVVEDIKSLIHDHLNSTKEAWLVQGLFDYSMSKGSLRAMEILLGLRETHSKHLLDKLSESLRSSNSRLSSLIFMGFLVRKQPQWLHKISSHYVMRDLIKVLKTDGGVVVLVNALLVLTALIPIIPNLESSILNEIFESFTRLAAWNYSNQPKQPEVYVLHLQIALYALFHRLYGMYPCNFLSYLRQHYSLRDNLPIFSHTVKPMVETVRMHPLLVTASKDIEIGTARWKQMSVHDIVTECAKYSLLECQDLSNREEMICSNLVHSSTCALEPVIVSAAQPAPWLDEAMNVAGEWTWPAQWVPQGPASTKAPLSARVTPKPDPTESFLKQQQAASIPPSSSVARTLSLTPTASPLPLPPTSPMKKDLHSFKFPGAGVVVGATGEHDRRSTVIGVKLQKIGQEPASNSFAHFGPVLSGMRSRHSSGAPSADPRKNLMSPSTLLQTDPLSPAQLANKPTDKDRDQISAEDREVCRLLSTKPAPKDFEKETHALSQSWVQSREGTPCALPPSRPDSLLQDKIDDVRHDDSEPEDYSRACHEDDNYGDDVLESRPITAGHGPGAGGGVTHTSCQSGGLPMVDQTRFSDFVQRVKRLRYFSQCLPVASANQGSPGSGSSIGTVVDSTSSFGQTMATLPSRSRKRSNSCPNLLQLDFNGDQRTAVVAEGGNKEEPSSSSSSTAQQQSTGCQTDQDLWPPTPYEHLFFSVLPPSLLFPPPPAPAEAPPRSLAPSELLDRYIDAAFRNHERSMALLGKPNATEDVALLKGQVLMLQSQLQFERHRREVHAERNRRLLAKAKQGRLVEEELHTMRLQLVQAQNEMAAVRRDAESMRRLRNAAETERAQAVLQFEERTKKMFQELQDISSDRCEREEELLTARDQVRSLRREADRLHAALFTVDAEMKDLRRQANESRRYQQDLKDSQYHLIAARETANLLQQQLMNPSGAVLKYEMEEMTRAYKEELKAHWEKLERERRQNEALTSKLAEMESAAGRRETDISDLKRLLQLVKEEHQQVMQVAEHKYESIKSINVALENNILQLRHQVELGRSRQSRRRLITQQREDGSGGATALPAGSSSSAMPSSVPGFSTSPSSPPSFSSISGASTEQLSVSLAVEASEGLNYWQTIETSALAQVGADLPHEGSGNVDRSHSLDIDRNAKKPTSE
ncbi:hamartin-like isoform X1 [Daphnia pulicaria]|uniref:hamartin-like isoform X1 n=1 Tax=Daphnia pulicaria TaxID=35523 RepID=UPI001EE9C085|nr:hamartin-like isoform X1 [Daphnia pulicaria]